MSTPYRRFAAFVARWLAAVCLLGGGAAAWADDDDPPGRVGRLAHVDGSVWIYSDEAQEWLAATRNRPVTGGDRFATEPQARAEIRVGSTTLRLGGDSELEVVRIDDERLRWRLHAGSLAVHVVSRDTAREIEVLTRDGRFLPQQSGHYRIDREETTSVATAWSGSLRFEGAERTVTIDQGQRVEVWDDGDTRYSLSTSRPDAFSDWALAEQREDERLAASRHVSPEMTGAEDLDRHGHWDMHAEYGALWVPRVVVAGWAPYRYGRWAFVRPWGWTWIDDAPWGFAPFHYGRWVHHRGAWAWAPGRYVARPVYAPALVAWIGGPRVGVSIRVGSAPTVGWFPLGPREVYVPGHRASHRYVRNVNVTHVTNVTNITNVTNVTNVTRGHDRSGRPVHGHGNRYVNRSAPDGVTVVPTRVVAEREPVGPAIRQIDERTRRDAMARPVTYAAPVGAPSTLRHPTHVAATREAIPRVPPPPGRAPGQRPGRDGDAVGDRATSTLRGAEGRDRWTGTDRPRGRWSADRPGATGGAPRGDGDRSRGEPTFGEHTARPAGPDTARPGGGERPSPRGRGGEPTFGEHTARPAGPDTARPGGSERPSPRGRGGEPTFGEHTARPVPDFARPGRGEGMPPPSRTEPAFGEHTARPPQAPLAPSGRTERPSPGPRHAQAGSDRWERDDSPSSRFRDGGTGRPDGGRDERDRVFRPPQAPAPPATGTVPSVRPPGSFGAPSARPEGASPPSVRPDPRAVPQAPRNNGQPGPRHGQGHRGAMSDDRPGSSARAAVAPARNDRRASPPGARAEHGSAPRMQPRMGGGQTGRSGAQASPRGAMR